MKTFLLKPAHLADDVFYAIPQRTAPMQTRAIVREPIAERDEWLDDEYRQAYMEGFLEQNIAWQIKINRVKRNLSQRDLARHIGTRQSAISRAEDPTYGKHSIEMLTKLANAFDCALSVKFIPYSALAFFAQDLSESALYAKPFADEKFKIEARNDESY